MAATTAAALACLLLLLIAGARPQDAGTPLCQRQGCTCAENTATCDFAPDQVVQVGAGALPAGSSVSEVSVSGARELHVLAGALSGVRLLQRLRLRHVGKVVLRKAALQAYAEPHAILEVSDCGVLVLESKACQGLRGSLIALVARCGHVLLQAGVFARLLALTVAHVPHLQMQSNALALDVSAGQVTVVNLTHVLMPELAKNTFPSSAVEVRLQDCEVVSVREEAFSMLLLARLSLVNSSLHDVAASAFSQRTLIDHLLVSGSRIHRLRRGALLAAVTNLTIERSRIDEVESGAVNNTAARVTLQHNHVALVRRQGFVFRKWNRLRVVNNTFDQLEEDSIWAPYQTVAGAPVSELRFSENRLGSVSAGGLRWLGAAADGVGSATAAGNELVGTACRCDLGAAPWAADALLCRPAAPLLARCLQPHAAAGAAPQPQLTLANFTAAVCGDGDVIVCQEPPAVLANADGEESGRRSTLLLALLLGAAAAGAAAVLGGAWLRRKRRGRRLAGPRVRRAAAAGRHRARPAAAAGRRRAAARRGQVDADAARGAHAGAAADAARQARRPRQLQRGARHDRAPLRPHQGRGERRRGARDRRGDPAVGAVGDAQHGHARAVAAGGGERARVRRVPGAARPLPRPAPVRRAARRRGRPGRRRPLRVRRAARLPPTRRATPLLRAAPQHGRPTAALHARLPLTTITSRPQLSLH